MNQNAIFETLYAVNVNDRTDKRNGLTYLSWADAWAELKKRFPDASARVYENADGWNYHTDGRTCWVKCGVTVSGAEQVETLPVMDYRNKAIPLDLVTSVDVNKAIKRCITKAIALHGLGLYIYAGEDLPETGVIEQREKTNTEKALEWTAAHKLEAVAFGRIKKKAIETGVVPDKLVGNMTDAEFAALMAFAEKQVEG